MLQFCIALYLSENNPFYFLPPINIEVLPLFIMLVQKVDIEADQKTKKYEAAAFRNLENTSKENDIGVIFDPRLEFDLHINEKVNKAMHEYAGCYTKNI